MEKQKHKSKNKEKHPKEKKINIFSNFGIGEEKDYFIENLSMMLASGMPIMLALDGVGAELRSKRMKEVIASLKEDMEGGSSLWRALDKTKLLSSQVISLLRIGEESGRLAENLKVIDIQQKKEKDFRSKLRSAMMYPILVMSFTVVIGAGIAWFILPRLSSVFAELDLELPVITRALIAAGEFLGEYGAIVIPSVLLFVILFLFFVFAYSKTKHIGQSFLFSLPVIKKLIQEIELARFGYILGSLLEAGLPVVDALESLESATTFRSYKKFYKYLQNSVEVGNSFKKSFAGYKNVKRLIPTPIQQMIISGEQSGRFSEVLLKTGENFEVKTENTTKNLTVLLEPILLIVVWVGVVAVALAVILPIYSLIGGIN